MAFSAPSRMNTASGIERRADAGHDRLLVRAAPRAAARSRSPASVARVADAEAQPPEVRPAVRDRVAQAVVAAVATAGLKRAAPGGRSSSSCTTSISPTGALT